MWMSLVIIGDYGVGKTLLLDAAAKMLADKKVQAYFFCALDYEDNDKVTDDILDVIFRWVGILMCFNVSILMNIAIYICNRRKYRDSGITFISLADLRKRFSRRHAKSMCISLSTFMGLSCILCI